MSRAGQHRKVRGFRLVVHPSKIGYAIVLEETNGSADQRTVVAKADEPHTNAILPSIARAVKISGHPRTVLGPQRKAPLALSEEAGVRTALTLVATAPVSKARRADAMASGIENMAAEEAYYWYAKCMGPDGGRARKALRIFLAEK